MLKHSLPEKFKYLAASSFTRPDYANFSAEDGAAIRAAYAQASRGVFILMTPLAGICLLTCAFVRDHGLIRPEEKEAIQRQLAENEARRQQEADLEKGLAAGNGTTKGEERDPEKEASLPIAHDARDSDVEKGSEAEYEKADDIIEPISGPPEPNISPERLAKGL